MLQNEGRLEEERNNEFSFGPLSEDKLFNPSFYNWNHVYFPYCESASWSSDKKEPVLVDSSLFSSKAKGLGKATDVLVV